MKMLVLGNEAINLDAVQRMTMGENGRGDMVLGVQWTDSTMWVVGEPQATKWWTAMLSLPSVYVRDSNGHFPAVARRAPVHEGA